VSVFLLMRAAVASAGSLGNGVLYVGVLCRVGYSCIASDYDPYCRPTLQTSFPRLNALWMRSAWYMHCIKNHTFQDYATRRVDFCGSALVAARMHRGIQEQPQCHIQMYTCTYAYNICIYTYIFMDVYLYIHIHIYIYIYSTAVSLSAGS